MIRELGEPTLCHSCCPAEGIKQNGAGVEVLDSKGQKYEVATYLPKDLSREEVAALARELTPVTGVGFMQSEVDPSRNPDLLLDVTNHVACSDRVVVARQDSRVCAFVAASLVQFEKGLLYHLEGIIVDPTFEGQGLARDLIAHDFRQTRPDFLGFHTQNGRMESLGKKLAYINPEDSAQYADIIHTHAPVGTTDKNRYGGNTLYGDRGRFAPRAVQSIDWEHGDAIICIGPVRDIMLR